MEFEPKCQECPVNFRLERRAELIVETFGEAPEEEIDSARKEASARVSTMTQEGRQLGCPMDKVLKIRQEVLDAIGSDKAAADKRFSSASLTPSMTPEERYFRGRADDYQNLTYDAWNNKRRTSGRMA